jgi:hypothetical protein
MSPYPRSHSSVLQEVKNCFLTLILYNCSKLLEIAEYVGCLATPPLIQTKLTVGPVGDKYEQEADRVADNVVKQSNAPSPQPAQRREPEEEELLQGQFETAKRQAAQDEDLLQGRFAGSEPPTQRQGVEDTVDNRTGMPDPLKAGLKD